MASPFTHASGTTHSLHRHILQAPPPPSPHVLLVAFPAQGHTIPLLNLAKLLASAGVAVTYVSIQHRISQLQRDRGHASLLHPLIRLVGLPERVAQGELGIDEGVGTASWLAEVACNMENDCLQLIRELRAAPASIGGEDGTIRLGAPTSIVYDVLLGWMQDVARSLRMNYYAFYTSPASSLSVMLHFPLLISQGYVPLRLSAEPRLIILPGIAPAWDRELLYFARESASKAFLQLITNSAMRLAETPTILVNTCYELEPNAIDALQRPDNSSTTPAKSVLPVLLLDDNSVDLNLKRGNTKREDDECLIWLDSQFPASVLYVSFGSIFMPSLETITEIALGLEASSSAFLWVLRPPQSVASKGESFSLSRLLPEGFESRTKGRGFIISPWAPQLLVLAHPSIGAFLSHCGWNSTVESISMGVPLIAYPQFAEQKANCRMIVDQWKIGIQLRDDEDGCLRRDDVEQVVRVIMGGEEGKRLKENAIQLRDITRKSSKEGGSSYRSLQAFVDELFRISASSTCEEAGNCMFNNILQHNLTNDH